MMQTRPLRGFTSLQAPIKIPRCRGVRFVGANASRRRTDDGEPVDLDERTAAANAELASTSDRWQPASFLEHGQKSTVLLSTVLAAGVGGLLGMLPELDGPVSALEAIAILCGIVTFHELGHFSAARLQGIHVSKFAIGFGPTLLKFDAGEVEYSLRALPLGGFVAFPDNDEDSPYPPDDPNLLKNRPILDRFLVISAGVVFNIILAFMALTAQVANVGYSEISYKPGVRVPIVLNQSAAARSGILPGDIILALDDKPIEGPEAVKTVVSTIKSHRDLSIDFTVFRQGEVRHIMVLPDIAPDGGGKIGVQLSANSTIKVAKPTGALDTLQKAAVEMGRMVSTTVSGLGGLLSNPSEASQSMSGPVAVVAVGAEVARSSPTGLYAFAAVVNINLAVVNVLPLPALDGGYLLLLAIEAARREKLPDSVEQTFNASGFLLLMGLGVILIVKDTINIFPK